MAGTTINGQAFPLWDLFNRATYAIDYYQREYAWSAEDVRILVNDLCGQFEAARQDPRTRRGIRHADPYFLGPFVYYEHRRSARFLVDGQQRFTTVHLVFMHLQRQARAMAHENAVSQLDRVIRESQAGAWRFRIDIEERRAALQALYDGRDYEPPFAASLSLRNLCARSDELGQLLAARLDAEDVPAFTDWILHRVMLVGIEAPSRDSGFKIFESMNDRGSRLTPVDLLKSYLLSNVGQDEEDLNKRWREMLAELTPDRDDPGAPGKFLKSALIAHHARLTEGFADLDEINSSLHMWVRQHAHDHLGLRSPNQYFAFVDRLIGLATTYRTFQAASQRLDALHGLESIYYNTSNGLTNQMPFILAAVRPNDTLTTAKEKAQLVANFIDRWYVLRVFADEPVLPRDLDDLMPTLLPQLRKCESAADVATCLAAEMISDDDFTAVHTFGLRGNNSAQVRYILARLTAFAETGWGASDLTADYLAADRPWQIEHIFANKPERHPDVPDPIEFRLLRNRLGVLALLRATVNMSLQDARLDAKVEVYSRENLLLRCLHRTFQQNNKPIRILVERYGLKPYVQSLPPDVKLREAVAIRQELYRRLCREVWRLERLGFPTPITDNSQDHDVRVREPVVVSLAEATIAAPPATPRRTSTRPTDVQRMVRSGTLPAGSTIVMVVDGRDVFATIEDDGALRLPTGDKFRKADDAGSALTGKRCEGMKSWHIVQSDGARISLRELRDRRPAS